MAKKKSGSTRLRSSVNCLPDTLRRFQELQEAVRNGLPPTAKDVISVTQELMMRLLVESAARQADDGALDWNEMIRDLLAEEDS